MFLFSIAYGYFVWTWHHSVVSLDFKELYQLWPDADGVFFKLEVKSNQPNSLEKVYSAQAASGGSLFGAMTRLANSTPDFK